MTPHFHAVVWIDHRQARIIHFSADASDEKIVRPHDPARQIHHKANSIGSGHATDDRDFFARTAEAFEGAQAVLIAGPAQTKVAFLRYLIERLPAVSKSVAGLETLDHPTDGELLDFARRYFQARDLMTPQRAGAKT